MVWFDHQLGNRPVLVAYSLTARADVGAVEAESFPLRLFPFDSRPTEV